MQKNDFSYRMVPLTDSVGCWQTYPTFLVHCPCTFFFTYRECKVEITGLDWTVMALRLVMIVALRKKPIKSSQSSLSNCLEKKIVFGKVVWKKNCLEKIVGLMKMLQPFFFKIFFIAWTKTKWSQKNGPMLYVMYAIVVENSNEK